MPKYEKERQYYDKYIPLYLLTTARKRAKQAGIECTIKESDIVVPDVCPILGVKLGRSRGAVDRASPSLDRVDSSVGYVPGNVRVISWYANKMKNDLTVDQVRNLLSYMEGKL